MAETLSFKEIEKRYDSQWVLLVDLEKDKYERIRRASVLWHSPDSEEVYRKSMELKLKKAACLYMGDPIPKGVAVVL